MFKREDASREIEILREELSDDYRRTRGSAIAQQLISEQESLVHWARRTETLISEADWQSWVGRLQEIASGQEHLVYLDPTSRRVFKITKPSSYGLGGYAYRYLSYLALSNQIFSDDIRIEAVAQIYDHDNEELFAAIVISQPYIVGERPTEEEIREWFKKYDYEKDGRHIYVNREEGVRVEDAHTGNLIKVEGGELVPIDVLPERIS